MSFQSLETLFDNTDRPLSINIIGWLFLFSGLSGLWSLFWASNPEMQATYASMGLDEGWVITINLINGFLYMASGFGLLNARNWARNVFYASPIVTVLSIVVFKAGWVWVAYGAVWFGIIIWFLTRPHVNEYFEGNYRESEHDTLEKRNQRAFRASQQRKSILAKIAAIMSGFLSGSIVLVIITVQVKLPDVGAGSNLFMGFFAVLFLILSAACWGWGRILAVSGWILSIASGSCVFLGGMMFLYSKTDMWEQIMESQPTNFDLIQFSAIGIVGLIPMAIGILLIFIQYKDDKEVSKILAQESNPERTSDN
jgi:hypothetical protein